MTHSSRILIVLVAVLASAHLVAAQVTMTRLSSFGGGDGWLAPGESAFLGVFNNERGIAYGNNHLYLVSRAGGNFIRILDPLSGSDLGALNTGGISGGTLPVNMVAVGGDGAIYVSNLTSDASVTPFMVYRWATEAAMPSIAYSGTPLAGGRVGDTLAAIGRGSSTSLAAGFGSVPMVPGNNGYAIIKPTAGTSTQVTFSGTTPGGGDFRLGLTFADSTHVLGTQTAGHYRYTSFSGTTGTLLASPSLGPGERLLAHAVVGGLPILAAMSTDDSFVRLYDMMDPTNPVFLTEGNNTFGVPLSENTNRTGALAWGGILGNTARLYAMSTNQGIQAWTITVPSIVVTTVADHDDGVCNAADCTLREAINLANIQPGADFITFAFGVSGTIQLTQALPGLATSMIISGPGAALLTVRRNIAFDFRIFTSGDFAVNPTSTISGLTIANGRQPDGGGGILQNHGTLFVRDCVITGNSAANFPAAGGGILNREGTLIVENCTISGNTAFSGGGIASSRMAAGTGSTTVTNSTFSNNIASGGDGGALHNNAANSGAVSAVTLTSCTLTANQSSGAFGGKGGAILNTAVNSGSGTVTLTHCTLNNNSASNGGGISNIGNAQLTLRANILKSDGVSPNIVNNGGTITSQGYNLSNDAAGGDGGTGPGGFLGTIGDRRNTDPQFAPAGLTSNGGPTMTIALLSGSPAINPASNDFTPPLDQRGYDRVGTSDIGTFEFNGVPPPAPAVLGAVSRKVHNGEPYDIPLPLTGSAGVECRSGGASNDYQILLSFGSIVTYNGAFLSAGAGSVASSTGFGTNSITVNLTGITSGQNAIVTLVKVNDGTNTGDVSVPFSVLVGDTNGNRTVNATDIGQVKSQSGQPVSAANFRNDVNASGSINATDIGQVKAQSGTTLP